MKYRINDDLVEAIRWSGRDLRELEAGLVRLRAGGQFTLRIAAAGLLRIRGPRGEATAGIGDWIICGPDATVRVCDPETFAATYAPA